LPASRSTLVAARALNIDAKRFMRGAAVARRPGRGGWIKMPPPINAGAGARHFKKKPSPSSAPPTHEHAAIIGPQPLTRSSNCARVLAGAQPLPRLAVEASGCGCGTNRTGLGTEGVGGFRPPQTPLWHRFGSGSSCGTPGRQALRTDYAGTDAKPCSPSFVPRTTDSTHGQRQSPQLLLTSRAPPGQPGG
jgi:hypothetical protein